MQINETRSYNLNGVGSVVSRLTIYSLAAVGIPDCSVLIGARPDESMDHFTVRGIVCFVV